MSAALASSLALLDRSQPLPILARASVAFAVLLVTWENRRRTRRALARLEPHILNDIGLTQQAAAKESTLPFWRD
ncbi:MAG: DUF1127 domain-containing protein [Rhodobacteraceae bacterium]|jgi:uncharacterized protein YjiS (DUF1127 family)|nr:DUF1127 domain-containing protein [Paracoccaceae bacterium]